MSQFKHIHLKEDGVAYQSDIAGSLNYQYAHFSKIDGVELVYSSSPFFAWLGFLSLFPMLFLFKRWDTELFIGSGVISFIFFWIYAWTQKVMFTIYAGQLKICEQVPGISKDEALKLISSITDKQKAFNA